MLLYVLSWFVVLVWTLFHPPTGNADSVVVRRFEVPMRGLHPSLHGLKIAQLSDLHFNDNNSKIMGTSDEILEQAARIVESEQVDLVVLTGDYVDHWPETADALATKWLTRLRGKHGAVAILGNHDYQKPHSKQLVLDAFAKANVSVLINERAEPINEWLEVMGVGDLWEEYRPEEFMYPLPSPPPAGTSSGKEVDGEEEEHHYRKVRVVLTHNPDSAHDLSRWGADFMLAGHTHGGTTCLPPLLRQVWPLVSYLPRFIWRRVPGVKALKDWSLSYGWIDIARQQLATENGEATTLLQPHEQQGTTIPLYVTSGLSRMPPRFLLCHPEVAIFTLLPHQQQHHTPSE
jgi:predicted MPP superfamily phosphohydrolase